MRKKIIFLGFLLPVAIFLVVGFLFWQDQKEVWALNKTLPRGVAISKNPLTKEYRVNNQIDGYSFKIPTAWQGIEKIEYIPKSPEEKYLVASINVKGINGNARFVAIDKFITEDNPVIKDWGEKIFEEYGFSGELIPSTVGNRSIIKTKEDKHLGGMYVYFLSGKSSVYVITNGFEDFIKEIIASGQW